MAPRVLPPPEQVLVSQRPKHIIVPGYQPAFQWGTPTGPAILSCILATKMGSTRSSTMFHIMFCRRHHLHQPSLVHILTIFSPYSHHFPPSYERFETKDFRQVCSGLALLPASPSTACNKETSAPASLKAGKQLLRFFSFNPFCVYDLCMFLWYDYDIRPSCIHHHTPFSYLQPTAANFPCTASCTSSVFDLLASPGWWPCGFSARIWGNHQCPIGPLGLFFKSRSRKEINQSPKKHFLISHIKR